MTSTKRITTFNLDESLVKEFDSFCASNEKSRSKVANNLFHDFMKQQKRGNKSW